MLICSYTGLTSVSTSDLLSSHCKFQQVMGLFLNHSRILSVEKRNLMDKLSDEYPQNNNSILTGWQGNTGKARGQ